MNIVYSFMIVIIFCKYQSINIIVKFKKMIILDNKNGNLTNANLLKKYTASSLSDGDAVIYNNNILTDIVIVKTWEYLLKNMPTEPNNLFKNILEKIDKKDNIIKIHLIILGNKHVFLNNNKSKYPQELRSLNSFIENCEKYGIVLYDAKSFPTIAEYILDVDRNSAVIKKQDNVVVAQQLPKIGARRIIHDNTETNQEMIKEVSLSTISLYNQNSDTSPGYNIKEDNINYEPVIEPVIEPNLELLKLLWTSIPGITDKIIDNIMHVTSISALYDGHVPSISSVKYNTGTRFGIGRTRNLIENARNKDTFNLILTNITSISHDDREYIINNYTLGNILNNKEELKQKYPDSFNDIMLLEYKKC